MTSREAFCAVLSNGPLLRGDAIVVVSGDGVPRLECGLEVLKKGGAPLILVSGGLDNPPHSLTAKAMRAWLIDKGLAPHAIITENESLQTQEQAIDICRTAVDKGWKRLLLVTSPYHQYRAFLTFLQTLRDMGQDKQIHIVNIPASQCKWWDCPAGLDVTRYELLRTEFKKIDEYNVKGHVASYKEGIDYLKHWETARDAVPA